MAEGGPMRVAVMASGGGSNFQALLDRFASDADRARIVGLVASRETAGAIERAKRAGVPFTVPRASTSDDDAESLVAAFESWETDLIVLAGYLRLLPPGVVRRFFGRVINIHPALLPAFGGKGMYGKHVHEAVIESGARVTGVTVHFVDEAYDRGPIIAQWPVPVREDDDATRLAARVLEVEHALLPAVVDALARGAVWLDDVRRVRWTEAWFAADRFQIGETGRFGFLDADG
ncbi:MAG: phosphoribosylglycinamide formyltransferase [Gemmatimonadetes bacterium]|nr:phosphoribosylglycinamide formyltransferase [Gemmatimonadota bacterium]